ncbi:MAG: hypothetical protein ACK421_08020 [Pseudanabaenaceae cyanobacterium]
MTLGGQPYYVFVSNQRLWIPDRQMYTYPDVLVPGKPLLLQEGRKDTVLRRCSQRPLGVMIVGTSLLLTAPLPPWQSIYCWRRKK